VSFKEGLHILCRDEANVVTKGFEPAADMMRARTGLHPDQTARNVGQAPIELPSRRLQLQYDVAALIEADQMEDVLADIDANRGDGRWR
jgi:hypothetical protein